MVTGMVRMINTGFTKMLSRASTAATHMAVQNESTEIPGKSQAMMAIAMAEAVQRSKSFIRANKGVQKYKKAVQGL